jgi:Frequency clock protein
MATVIQQTSETPANAARNPFDPATYTKDVPSPSLDQPPSLYPAMKRRRLNQATPASGSQTSASRWFNSVNQNVVHSRQSNSDLDREHLRSIKSHQLTYYTGEPPFYLNRQVHGPTPAQITTDPYFRDTQVPVTKEDSENEDLRGVIDDLTVEIKRLRQMLRERRQQYDPQLDRDKILEVRTCGLMPERKRELEVILQKFASTIRDVSPGPSKTPGDESARHTSSCALPELTTQKVASYPPTDSAYASLSTSSRTSARPSNETKGEMERIRGSKNSNIKSYLHDIPDSLLPKHSPIMSEESKMRLVVRRLEQLFTGKNAVPGEHSQPLQQQKVSESAATADRDNSHLLNRYMRPEGAREAHIIPVSAKMDLDLPKVNPGFKPPLESNSESEKSSDGRSASGNRSPDQRPTRPLDLDIHRAQVAEENVEYIRHLGLPTPTGQHDPEHPDDGWLYLNLLISMAQLHTINVTPAFVRKSIAHLSTKFELSTDARKIRWKEFRRGIESSDDSDSCAEIAVGSSPDLVNRPRTSKVTSGNASSDNVASSGSPNEGVSRTLQSLSSERHPCTNPTDISIQPPKLTGTSKPESSFDYKPILVEDPATLHSTIVYDDLDIASAQGVDEATGQDLNRQADGMNHNYARRFEEDGPIIYYKNPLFYCDMSGNKQARRSNVAKMSSVSEHVLGVPVPTAWVNEEYDEQSLIHVGNTYNNSAIDDKLPSLDLIPLTDVVDCQDDSLELPASGIGGVLPDDHFMLRVQLKRRRTPVENAHGSARRRFCQTRPSIEDERLTTTRVNLPASKLPPPSYMFIPLSSESSAGLDSGGSFSEDPDDSDVGFLEEVYPNRSAMLKRFPTDSSTQHRATGEEGELIDSYESPDTPDSSQGENPYADADGDSGFDRAAVLERPLGIITGSLAVTVGAGSAASVVSNCSVLSSRSTA